MAVRKGPRVMLEQKELKVSKIDTKLCEKEKNALYKEVVLQGFRSYI